MTNLRSVTVGDRHSRTDQSPPGPISNKYLLAFLFVHCPRLFKTLLLLLGTLDIRYIYVDALCIIQDDLEDRNEQIAMMGDIYANAYVTISATSAKECGEGFLQ